MNLNKLLTGLFYFAWGLSSLLATSPIWVLLFAYDLGSPHDNKDRMMDFFDKVIFLGR